MPFAVVANLFSVLLELIFLLARSEREKDIEILLLRQQIRILQRTHARPPRLSWWEKLPLTLVAAKLVQGAKHSRTRLSQSLLLFAPETVLRWHRELVKRKWTFPHRPAVGRPRIAAEVEALIARLAKENPRWGYSKIEGGLLKLGYRLGRSTIRDVLKRQHIPAAPTRARQNSTWRAFLRQHQQKLLACDFFTVETLGLQTLYVLFFIEIGSRRIHLAGCTKHPTGAWVTQQARQFVWKLQDQGRVMRFVRIASWKKLTLTEGMPHEKSYPLLCVFPLTKPHLEEPLSPGSSTYGGLRLSRPFCSASSDITREASTWHG